MDKLHSQQSATIGNNTFSSGPTPYTIGKGRFVQRIEALEANIKDLTETVQKLEEWKNGMENWVIKEFGNSDTDNHTQDWNNTDTDLTETPITGKSTPPIPQWIADLNPSNSNPSSLPHPQGNDVTFPKIKFEPDETSVDPNCVCDICYKTSTENDNPIICCHICNTAVHQLCYRIPSRTQMWKCMTCVSGIEPHTQICRFCPKRGGAMVPIYSPEQRNLWVHSICVKWIPCLSFRAAKLMDFVIGLENVNPQSIGLNCNICNCGKGANDFFCIQCSYMNCAKTFHITCGYDHPQFKMIINKDLRRFTAYCSDHSLVQKNIELGRKRKIIEFVTHPPRGFFNNSNN